MSLTDDIPAPWRITDTGSAFKIEDARGRSVAWVYYRREDALKAEYLTREQAVEMAKAIARLSRSLPFSGVFMPLRGCHRNSGCVLQGFDTPLSKISPFT